jgi:hypothetical protein
MKDRGIAMEGEVISAHELKARWAFCEVWTDRWHGKYVAFHPEKIREDISFLDLTDEEKDHLVWMVSQYRAGLIPDIDKFTRYVCQQWTKDELARALTIIRMAPNRNPNIPFLSFCICPRFDDPYDPRVQADQVSFDTPFHQSEPVIVLPYGAGGGAPHLLIEGYLRSVLFMRSPNPDAKILVWFPLIV